MALYSSSGRSFVSEINVTPFVDVMLVLLIIFMITAPMLTEGLDVNLPQTQAVETLPTDTNHVVLSIKKDGDIYLDEYSVTLDTLAQQLLTVVKEQDKQLFLQADKDVPYGVVVGVMGRIKAAGIEKMGLVAERLDEESLASPKSGQANTASKQTSAGK